MNTSSITNTSQSATPASSTKRSSVLDVLLSADYGQSQSSDSSDSYQNVKQSVSLELNIYKADSCVDMATDPLAW